MFIRMYIQFVIFAIFILRNLLLRVLFNGNEIAVQMKHLKHACTIFCTQRNVYNIDINVTVQTNGKCQPLLTLIVHTYTSPFIIMYNFFVVVVKPNESLLKIKYFYRNS